MTTWLIYKHTNKKNGKVYIGQTKQLPSLRWKKGLGYTSDNHSSVFAKAIKKYGWDSFESSIIENNIPTQELANEREVFWISHYNSYIGFPNSNGYNMTLGGDSAEHLGYPVLQIEKTTLRVIKEFPSTSEASRQFGKGEGNASQIRRCCEGEKHSCKGFFWCYKKNYSINWKPKDNKLVSSVLQIDDDFNVIRKFESITQAVNNLGFSGGSIVSCCNRKQRKANGFFWCYERDYSVDWKPAEMSFSRNEKVYCFETNTVYKNATEAHKYTGANAGKILRCCNGKENGTSGLHFCFAKEKDIYKVKPSKKRAEKFSEKEIQLLKEKYPLIGSDAKKYMPSRTSRAINTEAHRLGLKYKGKSKANRRVMCVETNDVFESMGDAAKFAKLKDATGITKCCKGERTVAGGYHWKYVD